jgi:hypothetical protein
VGGPHRLSASGASWSACARSTGAASCGITRQEVSQREEYRTRRAGTPGPLAVCAGAWGHTRGARSGEGYLHAAAASRRGSDAAVRCPGRDGRCRTGHHAGRRGALGAGVAAARTGRRLALGHVRRGPDLRPRCRGTRDLPAGPAGQPARAVRRRRPAGMDDAVRGRASRQGQCRRVRAALGPRSRGERPAGGGAGGTYGQRGLLGATAQAPGGTRGRAAGRPC